MDKNKPYYENYTVDELSKALSKSTRFTKFEGSMDRAPYIFEVICPNEGISFDWNIAIPPNAYKMKGCLCYEETMILTGKEKSKKSFYLYMFLISAINSRINGRYENIVCNMDPDHHVMIADTELPKNEFDKRMQVIVNAAGHTTAPENFHAYSFKHARSPAVRLQSILKYVEDLGPKLGLLVIDKWVDLLFDKGSAAQANQLISILGEMQAEYKFAMIWTIHQNRRDKNTNGAAGTEANKEVAYIFDLENINPGKEGSPSVVTTQHIRHKEAVLPFSINFNEQGWPIAV